jgi:thioredoxin
MSIKLTNENFETEVLKSDKPVLIDFYADWCGPCKMSAPYVEAIAEEKADVLKVAKINIDETPDLAAKYGVMSIPTFIFIKDGEVLTKSVGAKNKDELLALAGL